MRPLILATTLALAGTGASATPVFHNSGPNLSFGNLSNPQNLVSYVTNPAAPAAANGSIGGGFGFGLLSSVGADVEIGDVPDLEQRLQAVSDKLDQVTSDITVAGELKEDIDDLVATLGAQQYLLNVGVASHLPLTPMYLSGDWGAIAVDVNIAVQSRVSVLDGPTEVVLVDGGFQPKTDSALYLKAATVGEVSLSYSRSLFDLGGAGRLYGGVRGNYYAVGLAKTLAGVAVADEFQQLVEDELNKDRQLQSGFGVDLGMMLVGRHHRLGATVKNVNSPSFQYDPVGVNCDQLQGASQDSCYIAQLHADRIDLQETWVMDPQVKLEAAWFTADQTWLIGVSADSNPVNDPLGNQIQMVSVAAGYATRSWWIPGFRLGYHQNLAGTQLSWATLGLTLFKSVNLDVAYGLDTLRYDASTEVPRKVALNLGIELTF